MRPIYTNIHIASTKPESLTVANVETKNAKLFHFFQQSMIKTNLALSAMDGAQMFRG